MASTKEFSIKQENMIADALGWIRVKGSGSRPTHPGDVISDDWVGECKTHISESDTITIKLSDWNKLQTECGFKRPVLFVDGGSQCADKTWCVVRSLPVIFISTEAPIISTTDKIIRVNKNSISFKHSKMMEYHQNSVSKRSATMPLVYNISTADSERYIMWFPDFVKVVNKEYI